MFSSMKMFEFRLKFHWSLFQRVQLTIFQHWFRWWLGADQATSHHLNQWWLVYWRIYASLALNGLTLQMLTLLKKYLYRQSQYSTTWDIKCLALINQKVRAFGMNPKVGGSSSPQVETFSVSKTLTLSRSVRVSKMNAVARAQLTFQMSTLL